MFVQLTLVHREVLQELLEKGISKARIAKALGVNRSTVYRELERNTLPNQPYNARIAQVRSRARKRVHPHQGGKQLYRSRSRFFPKKTSLYVRLNRRKNTQASAKKRWSIWLKRYNRWKQKSHRFQLFPVKRWGRINLHPWRGLPAREKDYWRFLSRLKLSRLKLGFRFSELPPPQMGTRILPPPLSFPQAPAIGLASLRQEEGLPISRCCLPYFSRLLPSKALSFLLAFGNNSALSGHHLSFFHNRPIFTPYRQVLP